jgi:F-type H+-transporting ATPase subunit epsilon
MARPFEVEVVAADRKLFTGKALSVVVPGAEGSFGVLYGHAPLVSALGIGELSVTPAEGSSLVLSVEGGFVEVTPEKVVILADAAELADDIDIERARMAKPRAEERLRVKGDIDITRAQAALMRAINRLRVAERRGL